MVWRLLVVDDSPEFLSLVRAMLEAHPDMTVVAEASSAEAALDLVARADVNAAVIDLYLPRRNGWWVAQRVLRVDPHLPVILMSATWEQSYDGLAKAVGARGFLSKKALSAEAVLKLLEER